MLKRFAMLGLAVPLTLGVMGCDVDVKDDGKLPTVDVEPGRMPDVDVKGPDIDVGTKEKTITVPDVDIKTKEKTITVPDIDVDIPDEEDNEPVKPPVTPPTQ